MSTAAQSPVGIAAFGAYIPYLYMDRSTISQAWGARPARGRKSIPSADEDSITMAVEAGLDCLRSADRSQIDSVFFASTTNPYAEKSQATLVATALNLGESVSVEDLGSSLRSGSAALRNAYAHVSAGLSNTALVVAADARPGYPKSAQELEQGAGGVAVTIGSENLLATIDAQFSLQVEIVDQWRNEGDRYVRTAESRFVYEEGYQAPIVAMVKHLESQGHPLGSFAKVALTAGGGKDHQKAARKLKLDSEKLVEPLASEVGMLGAAEPLALAVRAIEQASAGDKILVLSHGQGIDALVLTVTGEALPVPEGSVFDRYLDNRAALENYGRFLSFQGAVTPEPGEEFRIPASTAQTWRERKTYLQLHNSTCRDCGTSTFPVNRICPSCRSIDNYDESFKTDAITSLFTYSIDHLAGRSDDPVVVQSVLEDPSDGTRLYATMTDFDKDAVSIGMPLEFTFRRIHELGDFHNYFWKVRPLRREVSDN